MFELKVANTEVMDGGTLTISWCVDKETIKYLSQKRITDPQVVIVVAPQGKAYHSSKEFRTVVPLKDLLAYVNFRSAGANKIFGFISTMDKNPAKDSYLGRRDGEYKTDIVTSDGSEWAYGFSKTTQNDDGYDFVNAEPLSINCPAGCFAAEPAAWEKTWVNHLFHNKSVDQCDFRRRRLFAYTLQPIIKMGDMLVRLLMFMVGLVTGARNLTIAPLFHPLSRSLHDQVCIFEDGTIFIRRVKEDDISDWEPKTFGDVISYCVRKLWSLPFMPLICIPLAALVLTGHAKILMSIGLIFGGLIFILILGVFGATGGFEFVWKFLTKPLTKEEEVWYQNADEIDLLTCENQNGPMTFKKLPARKRTIYLRFKDLKSKVCKPYSV
jgi:hypothetical protein